MRAGSRSNETPDIPVAIVQRAAGKRYKRLYNSSTHELLDYAPQDNTFRLFDIPLPE